MSPWLELSEDELARAPYTMSTVRLPDLFVQASGIPLDVDAASLLFNERADLAPRVSAWEKALRARDFAEKRVAEKDKAYQTAEALDEDDMDRDMQIEAAAEDLKSAKEHLVARVHALNAVADELSAYWTEWVSGIGVREVREVRGVNNV